jgi:signal transduction histidine kinase/ActR/RegA family two-component response regulator
MPRTREQTLSASASARGLADWRRQLGASRPTRWLAALGVLAVATVAAVTALIVFELRIKEIDDGKRELTTLDVLLAEQTERALQSVDLILDSVIDDLRNQGVVTAAEFARAASGRGTHALLHAKTAGVPQLESVSLIAADGTLVNTSRAFPFLAVNVADRDYFKAMRDAPMERSYLSEPVKSRAGGNWTIYLARRANGPDGAFLGLVLGAIKLDYFQELYRSLQIGEGSSVSLWRRDGALLARHPPLADAEKPFFLPSFATTRVEGAAAVYEVPNAIDGTDRIIATRTLRNYPIVVNVTRTRDQVLVDWRHQALIVSGAGAICAAALTLMLWAIARQLGSYKALARALAQREEAVRERRRAEAQLRHLQKMEAVGQLSGGIAHDFNNILTIIIGNLEALLNAFPADGGAGKSLRAALRAAERAAVLTQRLLAFSRRQPLEPKLVDLNKLIGGMSELLRRSIGETIAIETVFGAGLWRVHADPAQLESALLNLVLNARDAMPEGGRITIETANVHLDEAYAAAHEDLAPGQYVMLAVTDTGTGMSATVIEKAFEPFFTTKGVGKGTGLGLSQVYGFLKQSGGHAKIYSELGHGTTVKLYLPRHPAGEVETEAASEARSASPVAVREAILIVEDDDDVRDYAARALRQLGYAVIEAADGTAALRILETAPQIRLLFTDVGLPGGLDGRQLADEARRRRPDLKVLFTTGYARNAIVHGGRLDPGVELIVKPFTQAALAAKIRHALEDTATSPP